MLQLLRVQIFLHVTSVVTVEACWWWMVLQLKLQLHQSQICCSSFLHLSGDGVCEHVRWKKGTNRPNTCAEEKEQEYNDVMEGWDGSSLNRSR